jgi:hypothetical protein
VGRLTNEVKYLKSLRDFMAIESKMPRGSIGRPGFPAEQKGHAARNWSLFFVLVIIVAGLVWLYSYQSSVPTTENLIASGEYQAVFLDNGQVYFGKLHKSRGDFFLLTDVFYLQSGVAVEQTSNLALTKLGSEAHGPQDSMQINREHILFIENMKNDSKVVQAIQQYLNSK